jgi:hypothetical protein
MAKRKAAPLIAVAGVVVVGALAYGTFAESGGQVKVADPGGGAVPPSPAPPAPFSISTLGPIGTAAQDPGGGGGGGGTPGNVGPPGIQGAQGSGRPQGFEGGGDRLFLSGVNLLDPNQSAATSGENTFPTPLAPVGAVGGPLLGGATGQSATGCLTDAQSVEYDAIPLKIETVGFSGAPRVHLRISGGGLVTARLMQQAPNDGPCQTIASGSGGIAGGITDFSLSNRSNFQFSQGFTPVLVISSPGTHTISTDSFNPSFIRLPGLRGV